MIGNLNGHLKLSLTNIEHEILKDGYISFNIEEKLVSHLNKWGFKINPLNKKISGIKNLISNYLKVEQNHIFLQLHN